MGAFCSAYTNHNVQPPTNYHTAASVGSGQLPPSSVISATDRAILDLKNARDRLTKYRANLERDEKKLLQRAKELHAQDQTNAALQLLKLRHFKLNEVNQVEKQLLNVLQLVQTINSTQNEHEVVRAMKMGKEALERMHQEITVDQVLELMDDIREQHEVENEISTLIGTAFTALDDSEIEADLASLEKEVQEEKKIQQQQQQEQPTVEEENLLQFPEVPTTKLPDVPHLTSIADEASSTTAKEHRIPVAS